MKSQTHGNKVVYLANRDVLPAGKFTSEQTDRFVNYVIKKTSDKSRDIYIKRNSDVMYMHLGFPREFNPLD